MIDRHSTSPLYTQVYEAILDMIIREDITPGSKLPTVKEFCEQFSVSKITVIKSLEALRTEGFVDSIQGKGFFTKNYSKIYQQVFKLSSFSEDAQKLNQSPSSVVLSNEIVLPTEKIANFFDLDDKTPVAYIERIRKADNDPLMIEKTFLNYRYCPGIDKYDLTRRSLYSILEEDYKLVLKDSKISIDAILLRPEEVNLLNLTMRQPAFLITILVYLDDHKPIEYTKQILRGDRYRLSGNGNFYSSTTY